MSLQEILAVPDHQQPGVVEQEDIGGILFVIRQNILETRRVRRLDVNENTPMSATARKVNSLALNF